MSTQTLVDNYEAMLEREFDPKTGERHRRPMTFIPDASAMLAVQDAIRDLGNEKGLSFLTNMFESIPDERPSAMSNWVRGVDY